MDNGTLTAIAAGFTLLVGQGVVIGTLLINARTERLKNKAAQDALDKQDALNRARVLEDRQAIIDETARKSGAAFAAQLQEAAALAATIAAKTAADQAAAAAVIAADGRHHANNLAAVVQTSQRLLVQQVADAETAATVARASLARHLDQVQIDLTANTKQGVDVAQRIAENTDLTNDAKNEAAAARLESNHTNARLLVVDERLSSLDQKADKTNVLVTIFASERARSLAAEGAVHLADAELINVELAKP